jgi:hypothetical protein
MEKSIIENDKVHLLGWILLIVGCQLGITQFLNEFNIWNGLIDIRSDLGDITILINDIFSLEVTEMIVSH